MLQLNTYYGLAAVLIGTVAYVLYSFRPKRCHSKARLDGKIAIVTGSNTGIGKATVQDFVTRGATVILACRTLSKGEQAANDIKSETGISDKIYVRKLDLGSLKSVRKFAEEFLAEFPKLHLLVNNAGIMFTPYTLTEDGFESQFGVNHLGHFALTNLLLPIMKESGPNTRIINLTSLGHKWFAYYNMKDLLWKENKYSGRHSYGQSKLCNILFTKELHKRLVDTNITVYAAHPGAVATDLMRHQPRMEYYFRLFYPYGINLFFKMPMDGAQTSIYCAIQEGIEDLSGEYFADCASEKSHKWTYDVDKQQELWKVSEDLTKITYPF